MIPITNTVHIAFVID